jgi:hypothetical protein
MDVIPSILWCNLVTLTTSSRRKGEVLRKRHELGALTTSNSLGEFLKELLASLLTTPDLIDTINNDNTAVCSFERTLQSFNESRPEMLFICLGVGGTARLVVSINKRVVPVNNVLGNDRNTSSMVGAHNARLPTRLDNSWYRMLLTTCRLVASDWTVPMETYIV